MLSRAHIIGGAAFQRRAKSLLLGPRGAGRVCHQKGFMEKWAWGWAWRDGKVCRGKGEVADTGPMRHGSGSCQVEEA